MKKLHSITLMALCLSVAAVSAEARNTKTTTNNNSTAAERIETHQAAAEHHSGAATIALGLTTIAPTGVGAGALTGIINFTNLDAVQILAGIGGTTGGFTFGVGGLYKRTLFGNEATGFHLGGGLGLGTITGNFAMTIDALAGIHYTLPSSNVSFHFDGGAILSITQNSAAAAAVLAGAGSSTTVNFGMGPLSSLLGATVVYAL